MNLSIALRSAFVLTLLLLGTPRLTSAASPIADALKPFVEKEELAGAVALVANKDKVLALEAVGFTNRATKQPMKTDALFWIASQTKPITGTALMLLVDEGKLTLDDAVEKFLPEFKGQQVQATNAAARSSFSPQERTTECGQSSCNPSTC